MNTTKYLNSRFWLQVAILFLLMVVFATSSLVQRKVWRERVKTVETTYQKQVDSLTKDNQTWKDSYEEALIEYVKNRQTFNTTLYSLQASLENTKKAYRNELDRVQGYSKNDVSEYLNTRYSYSTLLVDSVISLNKEIGKRVVHDLIEGDEYRETVDIQDSIIDAQNRYISTADSNIVVLGTEKFYFKDSFETVSADLEKSEALRRQLAENLNREKSWKLGMGITGGVVIVGLTASLILSAIYGGN